jgi:hypothetical protein
MTFESLPLSVNWPRATSTRLSMNGSRRRSWEVTHKESHNCGWPNTEVLKDKVVPLFAGSRLMDSKQINEHSMALQVRNVG